MINNTEKAMTTTVVKSKRCKSVGLAVNSEAMAHSMLDFHLNILLIHYKTDLI